VNSPLLSRTRCRAFTLVELLVVVALITVLAAILFPVSTRARDHARQTACLSNVCQITRAYQMYLQDWDEQLPDWYLPGPPRPAPYDARVFWPELVAPYLRSEGVLLDPAAAWTPQEDLRLADYALMTSAPGGRGTVDDPYWRWPGPPLSMTGVARPVETIYLLEGWTTTGWRLAPVLRHRAGTNAAFLDGHARWLPAPEIGRVDSDGRGAYWFRYAAADR